MSDIHPAVADVIDLIVKRSRVGRRHCLDQIERGASAMLHEAGL